MATTKTLNADMLSIIIPTLNEEKCLPELLNSIQVQDYRDYEIIVSDGNSEDNTQKIAKKHNCKVVTSKIKGPGHQRNLGALDARGDLLLFLDADTLLPDNFLSTVIREFKSRELDVAGFYLIFNSRKCVYKIFSVIYAVLCFLGQYSIPISVGAGILVKREYHERVDGFDNTIFIGEDHDYSQRISKGGKFRILSSKKIYYSIRRFESDGKILTVLKWLYCAVYFLFRGPVRKEIVDYKYGEY